MSNDRIQPANGAAPLPKPEVKIIVNGQEFFKPGMKAFLAEADGMTGTIQNGAGSDAQTVSYTVCTCNKVVLCTCDGYVHPNCGCNNYHRICGYCSCVPVH